MKSTARRSWLGLTAACAMLAGASCLAATSPQYAPDAGAVSPDAGAFDGSGGTCGTSSTWQVALGGASGGGTLTFVVPSSDYSGGSWTPAAGITYSFDATTCTVSLTSAGCPGGTFNLRTRACTVLTTPICDAKASCDDAGSCPNQPATCALSAL